MKHTHILTLTALLLAPLAALNAADAAAKAAAVPSVSFKEISVGPAGEYTSFGIYNACPESPDGSRIVFIRFKKAPIGNARSGPAELWICNRDLTGYRKIKDLEANADNHNGAFVQWLDNDSIAYSGYQIGNGDVYVVNADTGKTEFGPYKGACVGDNTFGTQFLMNVRSRASNVGPQGLYLVDGATGSVRLIFRNSDFASYASQWGATNSPAEWYFTHPHLSEDGSHIFFKMAIPRKQYLFIARVDGSELVYWGPKKPMHTHFYDADTLWGSDDIVPDGTPDNMHFKRWRSDKTYLGTLAGMGCHTAMSPDKKWFLGESWYGSNPVVLRLYAVGETTPRAELFSSPFVEMIWDFRGHVNPSFSRDGKRAYYNRAVSDSLKQAMMVDISSVLRSAKADESVLPSRPEPVAKPASTTREERVRCITGTPGCVAFWDFVKREPGGAHRFTAHVPSGATNTFALDAGNYIKDYWGEGREATYADFPELGRGPFGNAIRIRSEVDKTFRPFLFVPRERLHDSPIDIKGAGKSVSVVVWAIRESGNHALAGVWHEGTDLTHAGVAKVIARGQRQYALFAGLNKEGSACGHVSENGAKSFLNKYALHKCNSVAQSPAVPADSPAEVLAASWQCFAMTFNHETHELTGWLNGVSGDRWLDNPKSDGLIKSAYNAYMQGHFAKLPGKQDGEDAAFPKDQYYNPIEDHPLAVKIVSETADERIERREYRYTKIEVVLRKGTDGQFSEVSRDLVALRLNPWWYPHSLYTPQSDGTGGPFTIGRVIHSSRGVGFTGWIGGVAVFNRALSAEELAALAALRGEPPLSRTMPVSSTSSLGYWPTPKKLLRGSPTPLVPTIQGVAARILSIEKDTESKISCIPLLSNAWTPNGGGKSY